jgi:hypothetical protein
LGQAGDIAAVLSAITLLVWAWVLVSWVLRFWRGRKASLRAERPIDQARGISILRGRDAAGVDRGCGSVCNFAASRSS